MDDLNDKSTSADVARYIEAARRLDTGDGRSEDGVPVPDMYEQDWENGTLARVTRKPGLWARLTGVWK